MPKTTKTTETQVKCEDCGDPVDLGYPYNLQRQVTGWEQVRQSGGANKIVGRETTGKWRHTACAINIPGQEKLFD
jgi:hypothetical protein